jgi:outer membrane receptor protein involved in Fe transport
MTGKYIRGWLLATVGTMILTPSGAWAQQAADEQSGDIVVTATRRVESIQKVPAAITALDEDALKQMGADRFDDYARTVPGLVFNQNGTNSGTFAIRGISTSVTANGTQSPVAIYYDDIPALLPTAAVVAPDLRLFDVERIEVLRGPQGTLFGSGAMGGAIRVITNKPKFDVVEGKAEGTLAFTDGGDPSYAANLAMNLPVAENAAVRMVGYYRRDGGYVDNVVYNKKNVNKEQSYGLRAALRIQPTDALTVTAQFSYQKDDPEDNAYVIYGGSGYTFNSYIPQPVTNRMTTGNLAIEYDLDFAVLTSSTTYSGRKNRISIDFTPVTQALLGLSDPAPVVDHLTSDMFIQETRLASNGTGPLKWVVGAYYSNVKQDIREKLVVEGAGAVFAPIGFPSDTLLEALYRLKTTEKALFGQVDYEVLPRLTATAGVRLFENFAGAEATADGLLNGGPTFDERSAKENAATPKFGLSYQATPDVMIYGQAAKGYRVGQNNLLPLVDPATGAPIPAFYGSDSLWNYEVGLKSNLFGRKLTANISLYYIDWTNVQLPSISVSGFKYIDNAGDARSKGVEAELRLRPGGGIELGSTLTYNSSRMTRILPGVDAVVGDRLPGTPKLALSNFAQVNVPLVDGTEGYVRASHIYSGKAYSNLNNATALTYGDYNKFDLRAGIITGDWEFVVFIDNLTNADDYASAFIAPGSSAPTAVRLKPRTFGLTVRSDF